MPRSPPPNRFTLHRFKEASDGSTTRQFEFIAPAGRQVPSRLIRWSVAVMLVTLR